MNDSQRQAAAIKASISTYVATATLGVLAGALALFTWISQTFVPPTSFYVFIGLAVLLLVASIVVGGDGQDALVAKVAKDEWKNKPIDQFSFQSFLALFALIFVVVATVIGATSSRSSTETDRQLRALDRNLAAIEHTLTSDKTLASQLMTLRAEVARLTRQFQAAESDDNRAR